MNHPEFPAAAYHAPQLMEEVNQVIAELEYVIESQ